MFAENSDGVGPGFAGVDHDGLLRIARNAELFDEDVALDFSRSEVVVIIETSFADGNNFRVSHQIFESAVDLGRCFRSVMWMDADGGQDAVMLLGQADSSLQVVRTAAAADGDHVLDSSGERALDHGFTVGGELLAIQVAVRNDQRHFRRAPMGTSSRNAASTGFVSSSDTTTIMHLDSWPRSFRGLILAS